MGRPLERIRSLLSAIGRIGQPAGESSHGLLASVDGEVHEREAVVHRLYAAVVRPVGLEDAVAVP